LRKHYWRENGVVKVSPTYESWRKMKSRCSNPNNNRFTRYGGAGVTVHPGWRTFAGFLADMGVRPDGTSLDRIDPAGNYEPGNCRWASPTVQSRNRACVKLTMEIAREIRRLSAEGVKGHALDRKYGLGRGMCGRVIRGECWRE
jgi:hypothetical protein